MIEILANLLYGLVQGTMLILIAPAIIGLLNWTEARLQRRQGAGIIQPYRDLTKLLAKPAVRPRSTSFVFAATPYVLFAAYGTLAFMLPAISQHTLMRGDLILIIYVLGLARFTLSLAGLDAGASLGGLGASREMFLHFLTEIGLAMLVVALAIRWQTTDLTIIMESHWSMGLLGSLYEPELVLLSLAMFVLVVFEAERRPVDNSATHLELTMAQKAVTLEFAGRDLALVDWAEAIKLTALLTIAGHLFIPLPLPLVLSPLGSGPAMLVTATLGWALRVGLLILGLGIVEVYLPKRRLRTLPQLALTSIALSGTAILYALTLVNLGSAIR